MELPVKSNETIDNDNSDCFELPSEKINFIVKALRRVSSDPKIASSDLIIPDNCEKFGFVEGKHNLGVLLHFLADMLEE
jgi:hypothetical protein